MGALVQTSLGKSHETAKSNVRDQRKLLNLVLRRKRQPLVRGPQRITPAPQALDTPLQEALTSTSARCKRKGILLQLLCLHRGVDGQLSNVVLSQSSAGWRTRAVGRVSSRRDLNLLPRFFSSLLRPSSSPAGALLLVFPSLRSCG